MCRGEIFFARASAVRAASINRRQLAHHTLWSHKICPSTMNVRAKYISPLRVPTISIRPTIKHERTTNRGARPNVTTHRSCRGEKYFARPCAIDAPSPPRYDRAPAMRRRTMNVRAKNISPLRVPTLSIRPTIKHGHAMNRGARRNLPPHHGCTGEIYFAPTCANDIHSPNHQT